MGKVEPRIIGGEARLVRSKKRWIIEVSFCGHDGICTRRLETTIDVRVVEDVSIGEDRDGDGLLDCSDFVPVGEALRWKSELDGEGIWVTKQAHSIMPSLFPYATVTCDDLCPGSFEHPGVFDRLLNGGEDPELCCHRNG